MSAIVQPKKPWETGRYLTIVGARYRDGVVVIEFQDGGRVELAAADLRLDRPRAVAWSRLCFNDVAVTVPTDDDDVELTGFWIRSRTDPEFEAHLIAAAEESARRIGRTLAAMRHERGMTVAVVAARSGLAEDLIRRIERGEAGNDSRPQEAILSALGRSFRDLAEIEAPVP